jgi:hypothetical protein
MMSARIEAMIERYSTNRQFGYAAMAAGLGGILIASRSLNPDLLPGLCVFKMLTGIPCMFCGLTHAFHAISVGHFQDALDSHPLAFVAYGLVILHFIIFSLRALDRQSSIPRLPINIKKMSVSTFWFFTLVWAIGLVQNLLSV